MLVMCDTCCVSQAIIQRMDAAEEVMAHAERSRWLAMEAYSLRMKVIPLFRACCELASAATSLDDAGCSCARDMCVQLRQCDLRAISAAAQQSATLRRSHAEFASGKPVAGHFDYDFEDLIQAANTQIESVVSRVHICEQDNGNKRQPEASPGANHSPVSAAVSELAEELLMALRDCAQLRRCVRCLRHSFGWQLVWQERLPTWALSIAPTATV